MRTWLSPAGALAATAVGGAVAFGAGWRGFAVLAVFFVTSSLLTPGGGRRRPIQVAANGGIATICALLGRWEPALLPAFAGALAAAAADTWSTEIGGRSGTPPRMITTGRVVAAGTSGGVTRLGTLGGAFGACAIGLAAVLTGLTSTGEGLWIAGGGFAGTLADSVLGATAQVRFACSTCGEVGEDAVHRCGRRGAVVRGLPWMTNDAVNFFATLVGAAVATIPVALHTRPLP